jgi:molybdopterin molybdotransferase
MTFAKRPAAGAHVRRAGEDMRAGDRAIEAGARLGPGHLALAAMLDRAELLVSRAPVVTIVCTGDELRAAGESAGLAASIPESNSAPIAALASQANAIVRIAPIAKDDPIATRDAFIDALRTTDLLVTIGGVSVGDHDVVRPALERAGVTLEFWKVAMKPGKPLAVGRSASAHVLGLPGNPASAMVTFALFGVPLLRAMQNDRRPLPSPLRARLAEPAKRSPDRTELARVALDLRDGEIVARVHANQSSGAATSLAASDGVALLAPGDTPLDRGALVDVVRWADC